MKQVLTNFPEDDIFVIGGAMMYKTMLPFCKRAYVTKVDADGQATVFFPDLDGLGWILEETAAVKRDGEYTLAFTVYANPSPQKF